MEIKTFTFNPIQVNTYVVFDETKECIIIDAACSDARENKELDDFISAQGLTPIMAVVTHFHFDHLMGATHVCNKYNISLAGHKNYNQLGQNFNASKQAMSFGFSMEAPPEPTIILDQDSVIKFGNTSLKAIYLPGHSLCSVGLYSQPDKILFTGDVLFRLGFGRTDLPGGNYQTLMDSISSKIFTLDPATAIFPGHGPSSTIGDEMRNF